AHCGRCGRAYLRFDYRGHGRSSGRFETFTIGGAKEDTLAVLDELVEGPTVLVGSSMGGWVALLAAIARPERVRGLVLVAPAPDFTERLMWRAWDAAKRARLEREGMVFEPSDYEEPVPITRALIEDGRRHLLLEAATVPVRCPVHILHGQRDEAVPWELSLELAAKLETPHVTVELVKEGDHRMSEPAQLARLAHALDRILEVAS
ncbi:MAG TPA: alpha/beta hydrolase, partial [Rhodospirillales bacterium]|nr:alpha/beta hydrolase [Rhodospirillales bacterium]